MDSRYLVTSGSLAFENELPEVLELRQDTVAFVIEFICFASWDTVRPIGTTNSMW